jgi:type IV pilus assembly protein PilP
MNRGPVASGMCVATKRVRWGIVFLLFAFTQGGCGDDPPPNKKPAGAASASAKGAAGAKGKRGAKGAAPPPVDTSAPPPKMEFRDSDFVETESNRDPFRPFAEVFANRAGQVQIQRKVVFEEYGVDELKLIGIVSGINPAKAMLVDPTGQGQVVHRGDFLGKAERVQIENADAEFELNWRIERIREADLVLVREDPSNPDVPSATRVIALRPEETAPQ